MPRIASSLTRRMPPWPYPLAGVTAAAVLLVTAATLGTARPAPFYGSRGELLHRVYGMSALYQRGITGAGTTIAVIVPDTDPWLRSDLAVYSRRFGLPAPSLQVIDWDHATPVRRGNADEGGWDEEGTADLELAHLMAPEAHLMYVEIPEDKQSEGLAMAALDWLAGQHVDVVSFSWGFDEADLPRAAQAKVLGVLSAAVRQAVSAGVSVISATGDSGPTAPARRGFYPYRTVAWPASDPLVTAVGSVNLHVNGAGKRLRPDTVTGGYFATGAGLSSFYLRPAYQDQVARVTGDHRGVADVSMAGAAWVYIATPGLPGAGWYHAEGTSISAPLFAGIAADADQMAGHPLGELGPALYRMHGAADGVLDVTHGSNTDHGVTGYSAGPGYDLPSGIGTVGSALPFVTALARLASAP